MEALKALLRIGRCVHREFSGPGRWRRWASRPRCFCGCNPDLIIVRISGFGQTGPYAQLPGFGTIVEGMSGFAARTGFPDREPVLPPLALADMIAGDLRRSAP